MLEVKRDEVSLDAFFYLSTDYMFVLNKDGLILKMNPAFRQLLGIEDEQKELTNFYDVMYFEDTHYFISALEKYLHEDSHEKTLECRLIDQSKRPVWIRLSTVFHSLNTTMCVIAHDITDLKRKQLELEDDKNKLLKLIELVPHPIFLKDKYGKYTLLNKAQAGLFGTNKSTFIGKDDSFFIKDQDELVQIRQSDQEVLTKGKKVTLDNQMITHINGKETFLHTTKIPFQNSFDGEVNILGVSIDVTKIKSVERELRKANFELDSFVYKASHDLRAPLCSIIGLLNLIEKEEDEEVITECIVQAKKSVKKLDTYISDLTNVSRNSRLEIHATPIRFSRIIDSCFNNLKYMEHAERITLNYNVEEDVDLKSDEGRIKIIFMNLLSNSIKYQRMDVKSKIDIRIYKDAGQVCIDFTDNGIGIKKKYQTKVYDMFFRASEKSFGSGLGLYIVKQIIEKLNARITLESIEGQGTSIKIHLPYNI